MIQNEKSNEPSYSVTHDGWKRIPTVLKECEDEYDFDAALKNEANCHRLEEGRPWRKQANVFSNKKDNKAIPSSTNRASNEDKVTFEALNTSSKDKNLGQNQKQKYRVMKYNETINTSKWPGWRWMNFYYRTLVW